MRIGSLFSGYMGLDMAVEEFYGATTVWCSDIDLGACKILAHRAPSIPNLGDITAIDWAAVEPVDIITGGWPCQPFSLAGKRKGAADARALWPFVAGAVRALRPRLVVLENVAAIATAGELARASADLAALGYVGQWRCLRAADVGAPHGRARIFITATDARREHGQRRPTAIGRGAGIGRSSSEPQRLAATLTDADEPRSQGPESAQGRDLSTGRTPPDTTSYGRDQGWPESAGLIGGSDAAQRSHAATDPDDGTADGQRARSESWQGSAATTDTNGNRIRQQSVTITGGSGAPVAWGADRARAARHTPPLPTPGLRPLPQPHRAPLGADHRARRMAARDLRRGRPGPHLDDELDDRERDNGMMLTFHLSGTCADCGSEARGTQLSWPERINLGSIVTKHSLTFWKADCGHTGAGVQWDKRMRLDEESEALVEKARDKIRARRKRAA